MKEPQRSTGNLSGACFLSLAAALLAAAFHGAGAVGNVVFGGPVTQFPNVVSPRPHADAPTLRKIGQVAAEAKLDGGKFQDATKKQLQTLIAGLTDATVRRDAEALLPVLERAAARHGADRRLLTEIKRLGGKATVEVVAPDWLRSMATDDGMAVFRRIVEIDLNERTDGHKPPVPRALSERVTDDWLKRLAGQDRLRKLELSGTAVTSAGLVHLKNLKNLEILNVCLTAVDDRGFENLAGLTKMRRMVVCSSKITGSGFRHLRGMTQLESINLHSSPASDAGLEAIGQLTNLRRLEIVHTNVTDAGLKHLAGLKQPAPVAYRQSRHDGSGPAIPRPTQGTRSARRLRTHGEQPDTGANRKTAPPPPVDAHRRVVR